MRARRTHASNGVLGLPGGNEDNDLWIQRSIGETGEVVLTSVWEPTERERELLAAGHNVQLHVWGPGHPPVAVSTTDVPLGRRPEQEVRG